MGRLEDGSMQVWLTMVNWTLADKSIGRKGKKNIHWKKQVLHRGVVTLSFFSIMQKGEKIGFSIMVHRCLTF